MLQYIFCDMKPFQYEKTVRRKENNAVWFQNDESLVDQVVMSIFTEDGRILYTIWTERLIPG